MDVTYFTSFLIILIICATVVTGSGTPTRGTFFQQIPWTGGFYPTLESVMACASSCALQAGCTDFQYGDNGAVSSCVININYANLLLPSPTQAVFMQTGGSDTGSGVIRDDDSSPGSSGGTSVSCWNEETHYIGTEARTVTGDTCMPWSMQPFSDNAFVDGSVALASNYCRSTFTPGQPICYKDAINWADCNVPRC